MEIAKINTGSFKIPRRLWRDNQLFDVPGSNGFLYDFSRADTLFQEATGQTPAGIDQNVGLALDISKWGGKTLAQVLAGQPELAPLPLNFGDSNWLKSANTSGSGSQIVGSSGVFGARRTSTFTVGRGYFVEVGYTSSANITFSLHNTDGDNSSGQIASNTGTSGVLTARIIASAQDFKLPWEWCEDVLLSVGLMFVPDEPI